MLACTKSKASAAELHGRRARQVWSIGAQATSAPRSVSNCGLPHLQLTLVTGRCLIPAISGTASPIDADITAPADFKHGMAVNRDGPCRTVSVSLFEAIS